MKIDLRRDEEASSSGLDVDSMKFDMSKTAKLFHMLSSTLYSDKPGSIIRELSSNAYDSHKLANKLDVPFELTAPTFEVPQFKIRDFGVGLTEDEARKTILCYLGSSKDDTDDFIGGWGIGSKSPFAYASTYDVAVFKDGEMCRFTCWKDEMGIPNVAVLFKDDTTEPNGVEMIIPVEISDINLFNQSLRMYMNWTNYNVKLMIGDTEYKKREPELERDMGQYRVAVYKNGSGSRRIVYGGFSYSMETCIDNRYDYASAWNVLTRNLRHGYDIAFIIDTPNLVSFNMNREVLEQTERSRTFVKNIVDEFTELATCRTRAVSAISDRWLHDANKSKNLVALQETIDAINEEIASQDKSLDSIFVDKDFSISYSFEGSVSKLTKMGVYPMQRISVDLAPIEEQFVVAWSRRAKPGPSDRKDFINDLLDKNSAGFDDPTVLYVKAANLDEAKAKIAAAPDFEDFDITKLKFNEVTISVTASTRVPGARAKSDKPVLWDDEQKKRISFDKNTTYVFCEVGDADIVRKDPIQRIFAKQSVVFIVPTETTKKHIGQFSNIIELDEFEERAEQWFHKTMDGMISKDDNKVAERLNRRLGYIASYGKYGWLCENQPALEAAKSLMTQIGNLQTASYSLYTYVNPQGSSYDKEFADVVEKKANQISTFKMLHNKLTRVIMEAQKLKDVAKFLDLGALQVNDSGIAKDIKDFLKSKGYPV
jgi:hypothetical protein